MKHFVIVAIVSLFLAPSLWGQTTTVTDSLLKASDSTISLNLLQAPASPAFNLLGIANSAIDRPTDLNAFRLSLQNASSNFSKFPSNYGAEFAPAALLKSKNQTFDKFNSTQFRDVFPQSLSVSLGLTRTNVFDQEKDDSTASTKLAIGIKFSIIRPRWNDSTQKLADSLYYFLNLSVKDREKLFLNDSAINKLNEQIQKVGASTLPMSVKLDSINSLNTQKTAVQIARLGAVIDRMDKQTATSIRRLVKGMKVIRKGAFLDFATGTVFDFTGDRFENGRVAKAAAWLTGGYEGGEHFAALGILRYQYQPNKIFADPAGSLKTAHISSFDAGAKLVLVGAQNKFSLSAEALYRSVLNKNTIPSSWRLVANASYDVGFNKMLTLAFGRNFDGTISKGGNLIAALNFITGFGGGKKITPPKTP